MIKRQLYCIFETQCISETYDVVVVTTDH